MSLLEQLENELAAAEYYLTFARKVLAARFDSSTSFERALLARGIDQITADALATGVQRAPSTEAAERRVNRLRARIEGLRRHANSTTPVITDLGQLLKEGKL